MSDLAAIQRDFAAGVLRGERAILDALADDGLREGRFGIYRNNTFASIRIVLANSFPTVAAIVGEELFGRLAAAYVRHAPPVERHLMDYGASLPDFIAASEPTAAWPWLGDCARLDRARDEAYVAADATPLSATDLAGMGAEDLLALRPGLVPSARLLASAWPVHALWMNPEAGARPGSIEPRAERVLVVREGMELVTLPLVAAEHEFLAGIARGEDLGSAALAAQETDPAFDIMGAFARHLAGGVFLRPGAPRIAEPEPRGTRR
ncbi:MAG: DNA-binding domain-containing protein [Pseudomonadota bacterium]|nr:DNA-binding domain-containing protein [Pseudomonadota bacterium]